MPQGKKQRNRTPTEMISFYQEQIARIREREKRRKIVRDPKVQRIRMVMYSARSAANVLPAFAPVAAQITKLIEEFVDAPIRQRKPRTPKQNYMVAKRS